MQTPIAITALASLSPLGNTLEETWKKYLDTEHCFSELQHDKNPALVAKITSKAQQAIDSLRHSEQKHKALDPSVLYAIYSARSAVKQAQWDSLDDFGINIGSSRGATSLFEKHHDYYLKHSLAQTLSSPTTTLGNIASWVGHDLQSKGPQISHSITCSTALHSMLNGIAWLAAGMCDRFLVGGSEAPLTGFTIAQMRALKVYTTERHDAPYPCRALDLGKKHNTMILSEGAGMACLERGMPKNALAIIRGYGYATEVLTHNISISSDAQCFQVAMKNALKNIPSDHVDAVVMHAPGTVKGDLSEHNALQKIFGNNLPALTTNKWKIGHSFGASGLLSVVFAVLMLQHQRFIGVPFMTQKQPKRLKNILVNAVGFGGNAVSILISKP